MKFQARVVPETAKAGSFFLKIELSTQIFNGVQAFGAEYHFCAGFAEAAPSVFGRKLKTYAVAWIRGDEKVSTRIDCAGGVNPTWNDKLLLRIDDRFLQSNTCALNLNIYCVGCIKDTLLGSVRVLISDLAKGNALNFCALLVRRPCGRPQGILNIASLLADEKSNEGVAHLHKGNIVYHRGKSEDSSVSVIVPSHKSKAEGPEVESLDCSVKQGVGCYSSLRRKIDPVLLVYEHER